MKLKAENLFKKANLIIKLDNIDCNLFTDLISYCNEIWFVYDAKKELNIKNRLNADIYKNKGYILFYKNNKGVAISSIALYSLPIEKIVKNNKLKKPILIQTNYANDTKTNKIFKTQLTETKKITTFIQLITLILKELLKPKEYELDQKWNKLKQDYMKADSKEKRRFIILKIISLGYFRYIKYLIIKTKLVKILKNINESNL